MNQKRKKICQIQKSMRKVWIGYPQGKKLEVNRLYVVSILKYQQYVICELTIAIAIAI